MTIRNGAASLSLALEALEKAMPVNHHDATQDDTPRDPDPNAGKKPIDANTSKPVGTIEVPKAPAAAAVISRESVEENPTLTDEANGQPEVLDTADQTGAAAQEPADPGISSVPADGAGVAETGTLQDGVSQAGAAATVDESQYQEPVAAHADPNVGADTAVPPVNDGDVTDPVTAAAIGVPVVAGATAAQADANALLVAEPGPADAGGGAVDPQAPAAAVIVDTSGTDPVEPTPVVDGPEVVVMSEKDVEASFEGIDALSAESFSSNLKGFLGASAIGGFYNKEKEREAEKLKLQIAHISDELHKVIKDGGREAVKEGKLSADHFKRDFDIPKASFWERLIDKGHFGTNLLKGAGFRGAKLATQVEELEDQLKAKMDKLDEVLKAAQAKPSQESVDGSQARDPNDTAKTAGTHTDGETGQAPGIPEQAPANGGDPAGSVPARQSENSNSGQDLSEREMGVITDPTLEVQATVESIHVAMLSIEEGFSDLQDVEETIGDIRESNEQGGMNALMARQVKRQFDNIADRHELQEQIALPSLESFDAGQMRRLRSTGMSLEAAEGFADNLRDKLSKAMDWIMERIRQLIDWAVRKLADNTNVHKKLEEELRKTEHVGDREVKHGLAKEFAIGDSVPDSISRSVGAAYTLGLEITRNIALGDDAETLWARSAEMMHGDTGRAFSQLMGLNVRAKGGAGAHTTEFTSDVLAGNRQVVIQVPQELGSVEGLRAKVERKTDSAPESIRLPSRAECLALIRNARAVNDIVRELQNRAKELREFGRFTKDLEKRTGEEDNRLDPVKLQRVVTTGASLLIEYVSYVVKLDSYTNDLIRAAIATGKAHKPAAGALEAPAAA